MRLLGTTPVAVDLGHTEFRVATSAGALNLASPGPRPPIRGGVIQDVDRARSVLAEVLRSAREGLSRPTALVAAPIDLTAEQRASLLAVTAAAGAAEVRLCPSVIAAAIGSELPVAEPVGSMLVHIGAGRVEVAVLSLGGVVVSADAPTSGLAMNQAVANWLAGKHGVWVHPGVASQVKERLGSALAPRKVRRMEVRGRDHTGSRPREATVDTSELQVALSECCDAVRQAVLAVLADTPPELAGDIHARGIVLTGGGARMTGLDRYLREATRLPVLRVDEPQHAVVRGVLGLLADDELLERVAPAAP